MSMLPKKGDWIKCVRIVAGDFTAGCEYHVENVDSQGFVYCYNDDGEKCAIDFPHDPDYGKFEKID